MKNQIKALIFGSCLAFLLSGPALGETHFFPYFASGGGWRAVLILVNDAAEEVTTDILVGGSRGLGAFPSLRVNGEEENPKFRITLEGLSSRRFLLESTVEELETGFVVIQSLSDALRPVMFFERRLQGDEIFESVGIFPSTAISDTSLLPIEVREGKDVALAILPEALTLERTAFFDPRVFLPARIRLRLFDETGQLIDEETLELSTLFSRFVTEIFDLPDSFSGHLQIKGETQFSNPFVTGLFFEWRPFGWEATALPSHRSNRP